MANKSHRLSDSFFIVCLAGVAFEDLNSCVPDDDAVCCFMQHLSQHQSVGQQITNGPFEKGLTRNTTRSWWIALDTMKELENCLKKLGRRVSRKRRNWVKQQKAELNNLKLRSQLGRMWEKLLLEYFETR